MRMEAEEQADIAEATFKADTFINNPKMYFELFEPKPEEEPDYLFPENDNEFASLLSDMRRDGVIG